MKIKTCPAVRYNYDIVRKEEQKANIKQWSAGFRLKYYDSSSGELRELEKAEADEVMKGFYEYSRNIVEQETKGFEPEITTEFRVQDNENKHELLIERTDHLWIMSYIRPRKVKGFWGLGSKVKESYTTSLKSEDTAPLQKLLRKFLDRNTEYLNQKII